MFHCCKKKHEPSDLKTWLQNPYNTYLHLQAPLLHDGASTLGLHTLDQAYKMLAQKLPFFPSLLKVD
jgi:hypothetical protein